MFLLTAGCRRAAMLLCMTAAVAATAAPASSGSAYPFTNPLTATVLGTPPRLHAQLPATSAIHVSLRTIAPRVKRHTPPTLRYARPLQYLLAAQPGPAPLVFVIAGTGDSAKSSKCLLLARTLYAAGDSVACLPSPTSVPFMLGASRHPVPGRMHSDVDALYRLMQAVRADAAGELHITGTGLVGWSLGASEAAFLAKKDARAQRFNFRHVLLLNPAVSVWGSVKRMDRLLRTNLPGGIAGLPSFLAQTLGRLKQAYAGNQTLRFNEDALFRAYRSGVGNPRTFGALIGLAFRLSLANMAYAADLLTHSGVVVPEDEHPGPYTSLEPYFRRAMHLSFTDYINKLLVPYWNRDGRHVSKSALIAGADMRSIAPFLASDAPMHVFTNADDPILGPRDVAFLRRTFGSRARIRPHGGHLGSLADKRTIHAIQAIFKP